MAKIKYYYDTETCKYELLKTSKSEIVWNTLGFILTSVLFGAGLLYLYVQFFNSPKELILKKENSTLLFYYDLINKELDETTNVIAELESRDNSIYRVIFEATPISTEKRTSDDGINKYKELLNKKVKPQKLIASTLLKMELLKKRVSIQSKSFDEIMILARNKSKMYSSIPAIQPISNKELKALASGFGMRIHPIYKVKMMHTGVDFAAVRGTPIYATGDGVIKATIRNLGGYGNEIEINHGYGYITKYAHLEKFSVREGQKVKRGECIGYVGTSGTSTAPHLHYEVIKNGEKVNPIYYFFNDITPAEYETLLKLASEENQSLS
ncbi:MAG: M23 family metallopeptidase [Cytophagales bacterium]|nr:MAG: M23 family metallopeptidase [Cytophagales bacterium]